MTKSTASLREMTQPRRGLNREELAIYVGVSPTKFDEMVADDRLPQPKVIDGRLTWDIRKLDIAWDALPDRPSKAACNPWDDEEDCAA